MTGETVIKGQLALLAWREGHVHGGLDNSLAVAFVVRNRVRAGWHGGSWAGVLENHSLYSSVLEIPSPKLPDMRDPNVMRLFQMIDGVYEGSLQDKLTVAPSMKTGEGRGGLFYAELHHVTRPWFVSHVLGDQENHPRTSQVGQVTFFA